MSEALDSVKQRQGNRHKQRGEGSHADIPSREPNCYTNNAQQVASCRRYALQTLTALRMICLGVRLGGPGAKPLNAVAMTSSNPFQLFAFQGRGGVQAAQVTSAEVLSSGMQGLNNNTIGCSNCSSIKHNLPESRQHGSLQATGQVMEPPLTTASPGQQAPPACSGAAIIAHKTQGYHSTASRSRGSESTEKATKKRRTASSPLSGQARGLPEKLSAMPLRLILIGHNPSEHAWHTGHYYSNPSNRMWPTLIKTGIAPAGCTGCEADDLMPEQVGVGFTDVGSGQPGTDSSKFTSSDFQQWRSNFYSRLFQHMKQASDNIGCTCGQCGAPAVVAFTGKRHYMELMNLDASGKPLRGKARVNPATVPLGPQPPSQLPAGWPLPPDKTQVWVLTSTSGAAPLSNADRERPYAQLAEHLKQIDWPRSNIKLQCQ